MTTPTTIVELRSTLLQVPWRGQPPAAGILAAPLRDIFGCPEARPLRLAQILVNQVATS